MATLRSSPLWTSLSPERRLALMGALEADSGEGWADSAKNTISANANRAGKLGWGIDAVLDYRAPGRAYGWYQPLDEPGQYARAEQYLADPRFAELEKEAVGQLARITGRDGSLPDRVGGGTHYLAHARVMRSLEDSNPGKYRDWGPRGSNWSGYDPELQDYKSKTFQDASHAFIAPEGAFGDRSVASTAAPPVQPSAVQYSTSPPKAQRANMPNSSLRPKKRSAYVKALAEGLSAAPPVQAGDHWMSGLGHVVAKTTGAYMQGKNAQEENDRLNNFTDAVSTRDPAAIESALAEYDPKTAATLILSDAKSKRAQGANADTLKTQHDYRMQEIERRAQLKGGGGGGGKWRVTKDPANGRAYLYNEATGETKPAKFNPDGTVTPDLQAPAQTPPPGGAPSRARLNISVSPDGTKGMMPDGSEIALVRPDGTPIPDDVYEHAYANNKNYDMRRAEEKTAIKNHEKRYAEIQKNVEKSRGSVQRVGEFNSINAAAPHGWAATGARLVNLPYQLATGKSLPDASMVDAAESMNLQLSKDMKEGFTGATSNYEQALYKAAAPSVEGGTPMGNWLKGEFIKANAKRAQIVGKLAEEYLADKRAAGLTAVLDAGFDKRLASFFNDNAGGKSMLSPEAEKILLLSRDGKSEEADAEFQRAAGMPGAAPKGAAAPAAPAAGAAPAQPAQQAAPAAPDAPAAPTGAVLPAIETLPPAVQEALKAGKGIRGKDGAVLKLNAQGQLEKVQ